MTDSPRWQDPVVSDLGLATRNLAEALRLIRATPTDAVRDTGYRDVAIIKVQEALWWADALRDTATRERS